MLTAPSTVFSRFLGLIFFSSMTVMLLSAIALIGPWVEPQVAPVLVAQHPINVVRTGSSLSFKIELDKLRDCRLEEQGYSVVRGQDRVPVVVKNISGDSSGDDTRRVTYPPGHYVLGPFETQIPLTFEDATSIEATLYYDCHPGWLVKQIFGPVRIPPP